MLPLILNAIPTFSELFITIFIINRLLGFENKISIRTFIYVLFGTFFITLCKAFITIPFIVSLAGQLTFFIMDLLYFRVSFKKIIPCYVLVNIIVVLIIEVPLMALLGSFQNSLAFPFLCGFFILLIGYAFSRIIPLNKFFDYIYNRTLIVYIVLINCGLVAIFVIFYYQLRSNNFIENIIFLLGISASIITLNVLLYISNIKDKEKVKRLKMLEEYIPILDEMITTVRERQHNYNNQLQAIRSIPYTYTSYEDIKNALLGDETKDIFEDTPLYLLNTNLKIVAAYLYSKSIDASKKNKTLNISIADGDMPTKVPEYKLIELLGVLIDNALEAIPVGSSATLTISKDYNRLVIKTFNQVPIVDSGLIKKMLTPGYSTKPYTRTNTHGLGLPSLKNYLDEHDGLLGISNETIDGVRNIVFMVRI